MSEDLGVEAKEAAVREVAKLLTLPDQLQFIGDMKADYIARQQVDVDPFLYPNFIFFNVLYNFSIQLTVESKFWSRQMTRNLVQWSQSR